MSKGRSGARRRVSFAFLLTAAALSLSSCAQPSRETFDLASLPAPHAATAGGAPLSVREPAAVAPTSTDRVVVRAADGSVSILPGVQWSERLPRLIQNRMIGVLQRAGVSAGKVTAGANRALATDIRRFEIDVARNVAVVEIEARILDEASGTTRAAQRFAAEVPAPEHTGAPAVYALTQAAREALSRLAAWTRGRA
ncbi:MAG: ABC transporter protein [Methylocystis sp.]|nr:MAG: ABC transporter protein [Methylocystis sp.]